VENDIGVRGHSLIPQLSLSVSIPLVKSCSVLSKVISHGYTYIGGDRDALIMLVREERYSYVSSTYSYVLPLM
jgi:hypothetical protein